MASTEIRLTKSDGGGFYPPCWRQVALYDGPVRGDGKPLALFSHSWSELLAAFSTAIDALDAARSQTAWKSDKPDALASAYRDLVYRASEFIELIVDRVPKSILPKEEAKAVKVNGSKTIRRHCDIVCNKIKHNQNRICFVGLKYNLASVPAFTVSNFSEDGTLRPNPEIHRNQETFSYLTEIQNVFGDVYLCADLCAQAFERLDFPRRDEIKPAEPGNDFVMVLDRLGKLPRLGTPDEDRARLTKIDFDGETLVVRRGDIEAVPLRGKVQVLSVFSGDGATSSFQFPYPD